MFENPRRGRQARKFTTNVPKILDLKLSSEQIFSENWRWVPLTDGNLQNGFCLLSHSWMTSSETSNFTVFKFRRMLFCTCCLCIDLSFIKRKMKRSVEIKSQTLKHDRRLYPSGSLWLPTHCSLSLIGQTMGGNGGGTRTWSHAYMCVFTSSF